MSTEKKDKKKNNKSRRKGYFEPIIKRTKYWPVVQLTKHRKEFIDGVITQTIKRVKSLKVSKTELVEELETTHYREKQRIRSNPWRVDPPDDKKFWDEVKAELVEIAHDENQEQKAEVLLARIIERYGNEIAGNFKQSRYRLTRRIVKFGFRRLLNAARVKGIFGLFKSDYYLTDKIQIYGKIKLLRKLAKDHTIVMVPTHFSNLDSILIGWVIHVLGLPPFIYGAGLNLFNVKIIAYFMNSLGAYKVDRRKRNMIYIETLKMYSHRALLEGAHSLFFPGGTRSRSGHIEKSLKRGLLSTAIEAQRTLLLDEKTKHRKIFVVPVVINYNFVLEAPSLINDYLKKTGQEKYYVERDEYTTSYKIVKFLISFFTKGSNISVSIGNPMDVLGNRVNMDGDSIDKQGNSLDISDYFKSGGSVTEDDQREGEYSRILSQKIVEEFHKRNRVLASHLVAWTAFTYWRKQFPKLDLFGFLRLHEDELEIEYDVFKQEVENVRSKLVQLKKQKKLKLAKHIYNEIDDVIKLGLDNVGLHHAHRPLLRKNDKIITKSLPNLFYYHNRMDGYEI